MRKCWAATPDDLHGRGARSHREPCSRTGTVQPPRSFFPEVFMILAGFDGAAASVRRRGGIWAPVEHLGERMAGADSQCSVHLAEGRGHQTTPGLSKGAGRTTELGAPSAACHVPRRGCGRRRGVTGWHGMTLPVLYSQPPTAISAPGARKPGQSEGRWISTCPARLRAVRDKSDEDTDLSPLPPPASSRPRPPWPISPLQRSPGLRRISVPQFPYCNTGPVSGGWRGQDGAKGLLVVPLEMVSQPEPQGCGEGRGGHGRRPCNKDICFACFAEFQCSDLL